VTEGRASGWRQLAIWAAALVVLAAACTSPSETPSASQGSAQFDLDVVPVTSTGRTIGGQRVVFLVTATGSDADGPVTLAAHAAGATISVGPQPLPPGVVGEVSILPASVAAEEQLVVTCTASRGAIERRTERVLTLAQGEDGIGRRRPSSSSDSRSGWWWSGRSSGSGRTPPGKARLAARSWS